MQKFIETLEHRQLMASGMLDASFGGGGTTSTRVPIDAINEQLGTSPQTAARQVVVDAGGRTTVLARTTGTATLYRLTETGTFDTRFATATGGYLRLALPSSFGGNGDKVTIGQDLNNRTYVQIGPQVIRITSSGKIDRTYGLRGNAMLYRTAGFTSGNDIAIQPDGSAYVLGTARASAAEGGGPRVAVARLTADGTLDRTFAAAGVFIAPDPAPAGSTFSPLWGSQIRVVDDGSIMATAYLSVSLPASAGGGAVRGSIAYKLTPGGRLFLDYGRRGRVAFTFASESGRFTNAVAVAIRGDGAVLQYLTDLTDDEDVSANYLTAATGRQTDVIDVTPGRDAAVQQGAFVRDTNVFPGDAAAGSEFFVDVDARSLTRYVKSSATYTLDATFNGGRPIFGPQAVATTGGGAVLFAGTGRSAADNVLTVGRVFATEAPSVRASIPPVTRATTEARVTVLVRDNSRVVFDRVDGTPTGAVLRGPKGNIPGRVIQTSASNVITFAFTGPDGSWDRSENGSYFIDINFDNLLHDDSGTAEGYVGTKRLGKLIVAI